ncbi:MAG: ABC transporter permease [Mesorhizobium sp.]
MTGRSAYRIFVNVLAAVVIGFLVLPILSVVPASLNPTSFIRIPPPEYSTRWFVAFFADPAWLRALKTSTQTALLATCLSVGLGTLAAIGLWRMGRRWSRLVMMVMLIPLIVPTIITGVALYASARKVGLNGTVLGLAIAHTVLCLPYAIINIGVSLQALNPILLRAADGLGASPFHAFRTVLLPNIVPGVAGAAVFSFVISFDELVVSIFLTGVRSVTLPVKMWEVIRTEFTPIVTAAAVVMLVLSIVLFLAVQLARSLGQRDQGARS